MPGLEAIFSASARVSASSESRATTRFTMPSILASSAPIASPVKSSSLALRTPSSQGCAKYSTPFTPKATTGSEKVASSDATTRSHTQTSIRPPAIVRPCTEAMVGFGRLRQRQHMPR